MLVHFYNLAKKSNSTLLPNVETPHWSCDCTLKDGTNILTPVLIIANQSTNLSTITQYNTAYIADFSRYYFIRDYKSVGKLIYAYLAVDVLASYKVQLMSQSFYILRSASEFNTNAVDNTYPNTCAHPSVVSSYRENPLQPSSQEYGVYIIGIINDEPTNGCVQYYAMSYLVFMQFCRKLFTLTNFGTFSDVSEAVAKSIVNPFQYVVSCFWLPYSVADLSSQGFVTSTTSVPIGWYTMDLGVTAYSFTSGVLNIKFTNLIQMTIPKHPQASARGNYLNLAPHARYFLNFYPFGFVELDTTLLSNFNTLDLVYTVDLRTGAGILDIGLAHTGSSFNTYKMPSPIRTITAQVGVPIPLASIQTSLPTSMGEVITSAVSGVVNTELSNDLFTFGKWLFGGVTHEELMQEKSETSEEKTTTKSNVITSALSAKSTAELTGMQGVISFYNTEPLSLTGYFFAMADDDNANRGKPLCQTRTLNQVSGFTMCGNAHPVLSNATKNEVEMLEKYLNTGFYME